MVVCNKDSPGTLLQLKSCPKCRNGDLALDNDCYGYFIYCIQCGYTLDLKEEEVSAIKRNSAK